MTHSTPAPLQAGFGLDELRAAVGNRLFTTVSVVAELMDLDERSVRRGIERGDLPGIRVGTAIRIPVAALVKLAGLEREGSGADPAGIDLESSEGGPDNPPIATTPPTPTKTIGYSKHAQRPA
jgi:excisionase family DNA binding protein